MLRLLWQLGCCQNAFLSLKREPAWLMRIGDFVPAGAVSAGDVLIDGNAIGDVGNVVLRDRKVLSEDGIFIVAITVNRREKKNCSQGSCSYAWDLFISRRVAIFFVKVQN